MTGTGIGFDFSQLMTQFNTLDSQLRSLTVQGEAFGKSMRDMIKGLSEGNKLQGFIDQLTNLRYQIVGHKGNKKKGEEDIFGFGKQKMLMNWDSTSLQNYINEVNKLIQVIKAVQNEGKGAGISTKGLQITGLRKEVKEAQELLAIIKKIEQQQKRSSYDRNTSYSGAIKYSDNVNSLEQERQAIVNLEAAKAKLKKSDADYDVKLNELNTRIQQHTENVRRASQTSSQAAEEQRKNAEKIARINATTYAGAISSSNNATTLEQERQAVQNLEAARNKLSKTDADYQTKLDELNKRIQQHNENIRKSAMTSEQVAEEERKNAEKIAKAKADAFKTPAELISMKGSAKSLDELRKYAEHLQRTMATLDPKSKEWSKLNTILQQTNGKISNIENRMRSFTNESRRATSAAGGLATMIAGVFSAQQIFQYVKQLVSVTGEFEQMHIALNVITGDLEASNRIWDQTMELAKKSPFQARELVKYTRQLAAYRIETSKLHSTTKMLADVSAGLGVDMSRLILAYGQVRAAEYLRGTELRQFTEAGVPMLDELAKHFTEVEQRAISTAEVFDMISKRKVAFEDVSAVLEKMTGAGGPFYKMQEQMSNTIRGTISNLKDEVDLMMYEIGSSNSGMIKGFLGLLRSLVRNWEKIAAILKVVTSIYIGYNIAAIAAATSTHGFGAALTGATIKSGLLSGAIGALTRAIVRMSKAFLATPFGWAMLAISAIAGGIWAIVDASNDAEEQEKRRAEELAQALESINRKYEEMKNLISGVSDVFSDENSSLTDVSVALHKIVDLAKKEYNLVFNVDVKGKTKEQVIEEGERIATEMLAIEEDSKTLQTAWEKSWSTTKIYFRKFYEGYKTVGEVVSDFHGEEIRTPIYEPAILEGKQTYEDTIQNAQIKITDYYNTIKETIKKEFTSAERQAALKMSPMAILEMYFKKKTDSGISLDETETTVLDAIAKIRYEYDKIADEIINTTFVANDSDASIREFFDDMIEGNNFTAEQAKELQSVIEKKLGRELHVAEGSLSSWQERFNTFLSKIKDASLKGIDTAAIANLGDKYKKLEEIDGEQVRSNDLARFFEPLMPGDDITEEKLKKKVKEELDYWKSIKEEYENALSKGIDSIHTKGDYEIALKGIEFLDPLNTYVGNSDKDKDKKQKSIKILNDRIELIKKMHKQYLDEYKTFGEDAEDIVSNAYKKAFADAFEDTGIRFSGLVIDSEKLTELQKSGEDAGSVFSEAMLQKMKEVEEAGTYIRSLGDSFEEVKEKLKSDEGFVGYIYSDTDKKAVKTQISTMEDLYKFFNKDGSKKKGTGTLTIGYGHALQTLEEAKKYLGVTLSQAAAEDLLTKDIKKREGALNRLLDKHDELIITQEQYNQLFNNLYQGGLSAAMNRAGQDISKTEEYIRGLDADLKAMGTSFAEQFGADWLEQYKQLPTYAERFAKQLEIAALTTVDMDSHIDPDLFYGMKDRSAERAAAFSGDLEVVRVLQKAAVDVSQIDFTNVEGVVNVLKQLMPIAEEEGDEAVIALEEAIAGFEAEIGLKVKKEDYQKTVDDVHELFDQYELSLEIKKLNIPPDLAKSVFGEEYLTLDELKVKIKQEFVEDVADADKAKKLTDELNKSLANIDWNIVEGILGTDQMKELKKSLEKIDDIEDKAAKERMKTYSKYLVAGMNDRVKLKVEEMRKLKEIEESKEFTPEQKEQIKKQVSAEARAEQDKQEWEDFKGTEMYTMMFDDLELLGTKALATLQKKLEDLKSSLSDLPANEVKEIIQQISKIEDVTIDKSNPFKYRREEIKGKDGEIAKFEKETGTDFKKESEFQEDLINAQAAEAEAQRIIDAINLVKNAQLEHGEQQGLLLVQQTDEAAYNEYMRQVEAANLQNQTLEQVLETQEGIVASSKQAAANASRGINIHQKSKKALQAQANVWSEYESNASDAMGVIKDMMSLFGASEMAMSIADSTESLLALTFQAIQFGIQMQIAGYQANMALGVIGWILIAIQAIATILSAIFNAKDAKLQAQVEAHLDRVKELEAEYEEFEELIDKAWDTASIQEYNAELRRTTDEMKIAQQAAITARKDEKDYKNGEAEAVNEVEEMQKELDEMDKRLEESLAESFSKLTDGILDDVLDAAKDFTDAWYDAFKETGDGLSGLEENFEEMFMNLAKNQAAMQITSKWTAQWENALKKYVNDQDTELTADEAAAWAEEVKSSFPELNAALEAFLGTISNGFGGESGSLSELQKGIQGVTEETAQVLEALLNSMRLYVADTNNEIKSQTTYIKRMWQMMDNAVTGSSPFYVQMKTI